MSLDHNDSQKFKIEGSRKRLEALAKAIDRALQAARATPDEGGKGSSTHGAFQIEVEARPGPDHLKYVITSIEDAVSTAAGWAEPKRCIECEQPVALLFDDAFLETRGGEGVICCECYLRNEDSKVGV